MLTERWFYISSPSHNNHVLTVVDASFDPQVRVELRPNVQGTHQQWYMDRFGYLINKHSGCVLTVKSISKHRSIQNQNIMQARRKDMKVANGQQWELIRATEIKEEKQTDDQNKDSTGRSSSSSNDGYYLQLKGFSDYYLNDRNIPSFGDDKIKWTIV